MTETLIPQIGYTYITKIHPSVSDDDTTKYETYTIGKPETLRVNGAFVRRGKAYLKVTEINPLYSHDMELLKVGRNLYQRVGGESVAYSFWARKGISNEL